jgi:DNA-binding response OmpR family regulator
MPKKILVVDDSPTSLMWQKLILKAEPYEVITATDGQAGVEAALAQRPDLILMDVVMPRMNGLDACKVLRANPEMRSVPILMVTTRSEMATVKSAFENGCNEYITKPIDRAELLAKIKSYLAS